MLEGPSLRHEESSPPDASHNDLGLSEAEFTLRSKPYYQRYIWPLVYFYGFMHLLSLYGVYQVLISGKLLTILWTMFLGYSSLLSITIGAHRLYAHRAFKAAPALRLALNVVQLISGQYCMWVWVRNHRQHHKFSDTDADPHSAVNGLFFTHIGWLMCHKHVEVLRKGKTIDMSDLDADPYVAFQKRHYYILFFLVSMILPVMVPVYAWKEDPWMSWLVSFLFRYISTVHIASLINSVAHKYGNRPFTRDILPTENKLASILTLGEGWHNYHHTFPWDYRASELGQSYNFSTTVLDWMAARGWVWDLKVPNPETVRRHLLSRGDQSHPLAK